MHDPSVWAGHVLCHPDEPAALAEVRARGFHDLFRRLNPDLVAFTWWDYRQLSFPRNSGLRIDHVYASTAIAERCAGVVIDRVARKGKLPSDHAPVIATLSL